MWSTTTPHSFANHSSPSQYNPNQPENVHCITNCLHIAKKQLYASFDLNDVKAPKDKSSMAASQLKLVLNMCLRASPSTDPITAHSSTMSNPSSNTSHPLPPTQPSSSPPSTAPEMLICALCFTDRNAVLIELNSPEAANRFQAINVAHHLITMHICPSTTLVLFTYKIVMQFVPCDRSFKPTDADHLHQIEDDLSLPPHSITSATWIKKPKLRAPNQKVANVKIVCTSVEAANKLLMECIYISNSRVVTSKDILEPTRCNKCQLYSHTRDKCISNECCAACAMKHVTLACTSPREHHCISCRVNSDHASSDSAK